MIEKLRKLLGARTAAHEAVGPDDEDAFMYARALDEALLGASVKALPLLLDVAEAAREALVDGCVAPGRAQFALHTALRALEEASE